MKRANISLSVRKVIRHPFTVTNPITLFLTFQVWKESANIGCGQAISKGPKGGTFTVCNYDPPGNYENEEIDNVFPAVGGNYYDFKQESRYKSKKLKIQYTHDGHTSSTHTFANGQYSSGHNSNAFSWAANTQNHANTGSNGYNYGSQSTSGYQTPAPVTTDFTSKWSSFRPHTTSTGSTSKWSNSWSKPTTSWSSNWNSNYNYGSSQPKSTYTSSYSAPKTSNSFSSYRPNFKMSFGNSYNSLW